MDVAQQTVTDPLRQFLRSDTRPRGMPLSEIIGRASDYLGSGPQLDDFLVDPLAEAIYGLVDSLDHVGVCLPLVPDDYLVDVMHTAGFSDHSWYQSCMFHARKILCARGPLGTIELAMDATHLDPPHVAWRLKDKEALLDIGMLMQGSGFQVPDDLQNRIAFNRHQGVMFRYFEGRVDDRRVRLEFGW